MRSVHSLYFDSCESNHRITPRRIAFILPRIPHLWLNPRLRAIPDGSQNLIQKGDPTPHKLSIRSSCNPSPTFAVDGDFALNSG